MIEDLKDYRAPRPLEDAFQLIEPDLAAFIFIVGLVVCAIFLP